MLLASGITIFIVGPTNLLNKTPGKLDWII